MDIWIGGALALAGTLLGSLASFFGPMLLAETNRKRDAELNRVKRRGELLGEFWDAALEVAEHEVPFSGPRAEEARQAARRMRHAQMQLQVILAGEDLPVDEYIGGMARAIGAIKRDTNARRAGVEHGGQELLAWHRGVSKQLRPFRPLGYSGDGWIQVEYLDRWP